MDATTLKFFVIACVALLSATFLGVSSARADDATVTTRILELEREIGAAISRGDAAVADRIWSDAYQYVGSDGRVYDKAQRLALTKPPAPGKTAPVGSVDDVRVRVIGENVAVALVWTTWRSTVDGAEHVSRFVASHVWVREAAGWRLNTAQVAPAAPR